MKRTAHSPGDRWSVAGLVLLVAIASGIGLAFWGPNLSAGAADRPALPKPVNDALDRAARVYAQPLSGVRWLKVHVMTGSDHPIYQVQGTTGRGNKVEVEVTAAGRVIELEEHGIALNEVPGPVVEALKGKAPQFRLTRVEAIYQTEKPQPVSYGFEGTDGGKEMEIYISADGKSFLN